MCIRDRCDSANAATCDPPPTSNTYAYNANVYFQLSFSCTPPLVVLGSATGAQYSCVTEATLNAIPTS